MLLKWEVAMLPDDRVRESSFLQVRTLSGKIVVKRCTNIRT
jgi:hypothetical protein